MIRMGREHVPVRKMLCEVTKLSISMPRLWKYRELGMEKLCCDGGRFVVDEIEAERLR
jgi:hypothetical protein